MRKPAKADNNEVDTLAEHARALLTATTDVAGEKVAEARERLSAVLERAKETYGRVREKAVEGARAADQTVHEHPYQAIGVAFGLGALIGFLATRRDGN